MRKFYYLVLISLFGWSCQKDQEQLTPVDPVPEAVVETKEQIPIEKIFYHKATEQYIYQKGDPYSFENMKRAYELLQAKRQEQFGTRAGAGGSIELTPSHYSLKIYPRNESEQWRVERMQDVMVAYLPFDYVPLPEEEAEVMSLTRSMVEPFEEEVRYTVTYDDLQSVEGPQPPVTLNMPVLYVTWPATKPLPLDLDYEIVDQLLLPTGWDDRIPVPGFDTLPSSQFQPREITLQGRVLDWDITLNEYAPIPGLRVRLGSGSNYQESYTDEDGIFSFPALVTELYDLRVQIVLSCDNWKIVKENSTVPKTTVNSTARSYWDSFGIEDLMSCDFIMNSDLPDYEITRALHYYHNASHLIGKPQMENGIRIITDVSSTEGYLGAFYHSPAGLPYIKIFNLVSGYSDANKIGTILHEYGHFNNYILVGHEQMANTEKLITESYASYVGWYMTECLYGSLGYDTPSNNLYGSITHQSRQLWTKTKTIDQNGRYSPLFVDLFDTYNQGEGSSTRPYDEIEGFHHGSLKTVIRTCLDWSSCRERLARYVGVIYTQDEFDQYIANYDYWFENSNI